MIKVILWLSTLFFPFCTLAQSSSEDEWKLFGEDGIYVSLQAGAVIDRMIASGIYIDDYQFEQRRQPFISALVDFDLEDLDGGPCPGLIFRIEVQYRPVDFKGKRKWGNPSGPNWSDEYKLKANVISPCVSVLYRIPWRWKLRPYLGIGWSAIGANVKNNTVTTQYSSDYLTRTTVDDHGFDIEDDDYMAVFTAGLMYGKRWDMNFKVTKARWTPDEFGRQLHNKVMILSFGYRL